MAAAHWTKVFRNKRPAKIDIQPSLSKHWGSECNVESAHSSSVVLRHWGSESNVELNTAKFSYESSAVFRKGEQRSSVTPKHKGSRDDTTYLTSGYVSRRHKSPESALDVWRGRS